MFSLAFGAHEKTTHESHNDLRKVGTKFECWHLSSGLDIILVVFAHCWKLYRFSTILCRLVSQWITFILLVTNELKTFFFVVYFLFYWYIVMMTFWFYSESTAHKGFLYKKSWRTIRRDSHHIPNQVSTRLWLYNSRWRRTWRRISTDQKRCTSWACRSR